MIETYDSFQAAKQELKGQFDAVAPSLLTSLSLSFSSEGQLVRFLPRQCAVAGKSANGKSIIDLRFEFSGTGVVSTNFDDDQLNENTILAVNKAKLIDRKIAPFFYYGSIEDDALKRFLYFFLFVERLVHATFSNIDHQAAVSNLLSGFTHVEAYGQKLLATHRDSWKDLRNRFIWCVMHKWTHLTDSDIKQFDELKSIRDAISHGDLSEPSRYAVTSIESLAFRIQGAHKINDQR